jgi:glucose-1-phosphate thymidylyltransferase
MVGVVAAGGSGSRLSPLTSYINKHLAPCEPGKLMIDYPLQTMRDAGFDEVIVVTGSNHASQIVDYVADGEKYGFTKVEYAFQAKPAGIADVLKRINDKEQDSDLLLILGDNYFSEKLEVPYPSGVKGKAVAWEYDIGDIFAAKKFGQAVRNDQGMVTDIVEKPDKTYSSRILTGLYYFPQDVFEKVQALNPSARNELEITHLLKLYLLEERLLVMPVKGLWADLGEWESLQKFWVARGANGTAK